MAVARRRAGGVIEKGSDTRKRRLRAHPASIEEIASFFKQSKVPKFHDNHWRDVVGSISPKSTERSRESTDDTDKGLKPKQKKVYVTGGIYHGELRRGRRANDAKDHAAFPFPMKDGLKYISTERDFQLPYNIYCPTGGAKITNWRSLKRSMFLA
jgi:hypothetical protein